MSNILNESGFLTFDLDALVKNQSKKEDSSPDANTNSPKTDNATDPAKLSADSTEGDSSNEDADKAGASETDDPETALINKVIFDPKTEVPQDFDWKAARTKLLRDNAKNPEAKKPESEILKQFWTAYLNKVYGPDLAKLLDNLGDLFKKDFTEHGFEAKTNPLATFFKLKFVKKLLIDKKLNSAKYQAIHEAFAGSTKLVADSEFLKQNSYNILYCNDLYNKPASDMILYLKAQKSILPPNAGSYNKALLNKNRRVFYQIPGGPKNINLSDKNAVAAVIKHQQQNSNVPSKTVENVTLNSLELVKILMQNYKFETGQNDAEEDIAGEETLNTSASFSNNTVVKIQQEAKNAKTLAPVGAALFYLSKVGSAQASKALNNTKYSSITLADLNKYSKSLGLDRIKVDSAKADSFAAKLINIKI